MPNIYLTDTFVRTVRCPADKDQIIYWDNPVSPDGKVRHGAVGGLGLRVTARGNKSFVHAYAFNGERRRKALGAAGVLNVGSARLAVLERERKLGEGSDPDTDERELTVHDAIDRYWSTHIVNLSDAYKTEFAAYMADWLRYKSDHGTRRGCNNHRAHKDFAQMYGKRALASIRPTDIERFQGQFASAYTHNNALKLVTALYNWAIRMQLIDIRNPCDPIRHRKIIKKRRDYTVDQIQQIAAYIFYPPLEPLPALTNLTGVTKRDAALNKGRITTANEQMIELCAFMGVLLLTMARPTEVLHAKFEHFDLERLIWHKHNTKGLKLSKAVYEYAFRSVPIHPKVAELVKAQRARWPDSDLLFPSTTDATNPRNNFRKAMARFKALDGVPDHFQMYDLKRFAISLMLTGQGVSHEAVSHYVDHKGNIETTMIYDLGLVDPLRPVTEKLGSLLGI